MDDYNKQQSPYGEPSGTGATGAAPARDKLADKISDKATDIKEKVTDLGRKAVDKVEQSRQSAAGALDQTASSLHTSGEKVSGMAHSAADSVQATADYVRRTDLKRMSRDVGDLVKRYPGMALAAAAVVGFLVARGLRSDE
jgi:ElaB/YqjD/DUF883 family membrane-anchored ribosome-binding protein